jgi:hypothetical protein
MKKNLLFFIALIAGLTLFGQPAIRIFAFEQENLPGTKPAGVKDENGNPVKKAAAKKNYFIFLSFKKTYNITPEQIFIRGKASGIQSTTIKTPPVVYTNNNIPNNPEKTVLVPFTNDKVLEVQVNDKSTNEKKTASVQKLAGKNDVVISYLWKKKIYFIALKKLKKLEPVANE